LTDSRRGRIVLAAAGAGLLAALGFRLAGLPLLEAPGWELGMAAALLAVLLGGPLGVAAARRELAGANPSAPRAFAGAAVRVVLLQSALVGGATLRTALLTPCSPTFGLAFVPAVALPSALAAAALGVLAGTVGRGRAAPSAALYLAGLVASLSATLLEGWLGPASYLLDPFLGIWPGPIYDEALALDRRFLLFRLGTLAWTAAMVGAAQVAAARRRTPPARSRGGLAVVALSLLACGWRARAPATSPPAPEWTGSWAAGFRALAATSTSPGRSRPPTRSGSSATARPTPPRWRRPWAWPIHPW
jgi:hypothetical protein